MLTTLPGGKDTEPVLNVRQKMKEMAEIHVKEHNIGSPCYLQDAILRLTNQLTLSLLQCEQEMKLF